jgi:hypothetical protein
MKIKTSELIGSALDWAVTWAQHPSGPTGEGWYERGADGKLFDPLNECTVSASTIWEQGGPIIEREGINIRALRKPGHNMDGKWLAAYDHNNTGTMVHWVKRTTWHRHYSVGDTALVAAMRCYVASKLGDEVDVPEELV